MPTWEALDLAGIVEHWLPEWALVRCRPQHSPVHRHTVDRHSLESVVRAAELVRRVTRPDLLLIAALLHDIGKGTTTIEHPAEGERLAAAVLDRWGMPSADAALVISNRASEALAIFNATFILVSLRRMGAVRNRPIRLRWAPFR